jgi:hypothetical protein
MSAVLVVGPNGPPIRGESLMGSKQFVVIANGKGE